MIRLVVPGAIDQPTGGYRYDAALLKALQWSGIDAEVVEIHDLDDPLELQALLRERQSAMPVACHLIVDGLALSHLASRAPALLQAFTRTSSQHSSLIALVHHPLCDETGVDHEQQDVLRKLEHEALQQVDLIITTSRYTRERVRVLFTPRQPIVAIEPGVDRPARLMKKTHHIGAGSLKLLCVASVVPRKGQDILVRALRRLSSLNIHSTLVGALDRDAAFVAKIRQLIDESGLEDRIELTGELDDAALEREWQSTDLLVLPSWYEGYGMVLDEAAARGVPVASTTGGALATTFQTGNGLQVSPGDVSALTAAIERFANDPDLLASCRTTALANSHHQRSWEEAAAELHLMLELTGGRERRMDLFDEAWLVLREPFDHKARAGNQAEQALLTWAQDMAAQDRPLTLVDLGSGRGSNLRYLDACLTASAGRLITRRVAMDHDPAMLRTLARQPDTLVRLVDLRDHDTFEFAVRELADAEAVLLLTGSALLDLVSEAWLAMVLELARRYRAVLLFTLSVDGSSTFCPADADDDFVQQLFNTHQRRGASPGPDAAARMTAMAREQHFEVTVGASDWHLDSAAGITDRQLLGKLLAGWREAVREQLAHDHSDLSGAHTPRTGFQLLRLEAWFQRRMAQIQNGTLHLRLGHRDLLLVPDTLARPVTG